MVRPPSIDSNGMKKGAWSEDEDNKLRAYIMRYGHWNWRLLPKYAKLNRCGKSCRLRWVNYLKPGVKRGNFTKEEQEVVIKLHRELGNKWSAIAEKLPGRTDNEIKNFWHTRVEKRRKTASQKRAAKAVSSKETTITETGSGTGTETETESSEVTSLSPFGANSSQDDLDLMMSHIFEAEAGAEFDYPELRYTGLSCPIDTSSVGINVGLIESLAVDTRMGYSGSLESPFYDISEKSTGSSSHVDNLAVEDDVAGRGSFWNDPSSSNPESESSGSYVAPLAAAAAAVEEVGLPSYDPILDYFGYETSLFW